MLPCFLGKEQPRQAGPSERLDDDAEQNGEQSAVQNPLQERRLDDPVDGLDDHGVEDAVRRLEELPDGAAERDRIDQAHQEQPQGQHHGRRG